MDDELAYVLDTETTGFAYKVDDRIIEIGIVEISQGAPTGRFLHYRINPERPISPGATRVCGITDEMVKDAPVFAEIAQEVWDFIGKNKIIAHNASFDMGFINAERARLGLKSMENEVIDTLRLSRKIHGTGGNSLDALCRKYKVSAPGRTRKGGHGALLDAKLLTQVYYHLKNTQTTNLMDIGSEPKTVKTDENFLKLFPNRPAVKLTARETEEHQNFCDSNKINPEN
jgi:DNA polymerase-3 subunit epsilon